MLIDALKSTVAVFNCDFLRIFILLQTLALCNCRLLPNIYWNSTNPIFRIDNTDHVFSVKILDKINIMCPYYDPNSLFDSSQIEYSKIYSVSRWSYDNCELSKNSKLAGVCLTPHRRNHVTLVFRRFTPLPGGLEFSPGQSYYFISVSNGSLSGLSNRHGGLCLTKNMKLKFEVVSTDRKTTPKPRHRHDRTKPHFGTKTVTDSDSSIYSSSQRTEIEDDLQTMTASPTPLLYIIHTQNPEDAQFSEHYNVGQQYQVQDYETEQKQEEEEDDDGGASVVRVNIVMFALSLSIAFAIVRWNIEYG